MQLSVIILNYNVCYFLEQCIRSVEQAIVSIDAEIIVVDNNSNDGSSQMIHENFPHILYIENKENVGFPKGNNIGVDRATGKYICILNPDTVVSEDVFHKLISFATKIEDLGIIGVQLIDGSGTFLPESKRGIPTPWVSFCKVTGLYKINPKSSFFNTYYAPHIGREQIGEIEILVGAFMFLERDLYLELGGFDEHYFMYSEDIDFSYTCLKKGRKNYYFPKATVIHYKGESTIKDVLYLKRFREGMQYFYKKHFSGSFFFDMVMRLGTLYFVLTKNKKAKVKNDVLGCVIVVSQNSKFLDWAKQFWKCKVIFKNKIEQVIVDLEKNKGDKIEIIFDGDFLSNKEIITFMKKFSSPTITFKIKPYKSHFIIGSNDSNDKGRIVKIDKEIFEKHYIKSEILLNL